MDQGDFDHFLPNTECPLTDFNTPVNLTVTSGRMLMVSVIGSSIFQYFKKLSGYCHQTFSVAFLITFAHFDQRYFQGLDRSAVNDVRVTSCSANFGQKGCTGIVKKF